MSFVDALGRLRVARCMKALATLAGQLSEMAFPPPRGGVVDNTLRQLAVDVPEPVGVPSHPAQIGALEATFVSTAWDRALWNTLIARDDDA